MHGPWHENVGGYPTCFYGRNWFWTETQTSSYKLGIYICFQQIPYKKTMYFNDGCQCPPTHWNTFIDAINQQLKNNLGLGKESMNAYHGLKKGDLGFYTFLQQSGFVVIFVDAPAICRNHMSLGFGRPHKSRHRYYHQIFSSFSTCPTQKIGHFQDKRQLASERILLPKYRLENII